MTDKLFVIAYNLLKNHSAKEINELVATLTDYNDHCFEGSRADCLLNGCEGRGKRPDQKQISESIERYRAKSAQDIYMSSSTDKCSCCGRKF
jgi:hypothetical protein